MVTPDFSDLLTEAQSETRDRSAQEVVDGKENLGSR